LRDSFSIDIQSHFSLIFQIVEIIQIRRFYLIKGEVLDSSDGWQSRKELFEVGHDIIVQILGDGICEDSDVSVFLPKLIIALIHIDIVAKHQTFDGLLDDSIVDQGIFSRAEYPIVQSISYIRIIGQS